MTDHDNLRRLAESARQGDWYWHATLPGKRDNGSMTLASPGPVLHGFPTHELNILKTTPDWAPSPADAEFIAAANPTAVLALLDELAAREAEVHRLSDLTDTLRTKGADLTDQFMELTKEHARLTLERDAYRRGQGPAPTPATPGTVALHETHPIPNSRGDDQ